MKITNINSQTGEIIERDATSEELAQTQIDQAEAKAQSDQVEAKATARASALSKLAALGLTPDEIASL